MKRGLYLIMQIVLITLLVSSCEMFSDLIDISFDTDNYTVDFTVNPSTAGEHTLTEKIMQSDIEAQIEEYGGDIVNLEKIAVSEAKITILTEGATFDTFEWIRVYVSTAEVPETLVGSASISADGLTQIILELSEEDLKEILEAEEYTLKITGSLGEELVIAIDMSLTLKYKVQL